MKQVLFLGDSITAAFDVEKYITNYKVTNRGVSGDASYECYSRLKNEWFLNIDLVFICVGTNDLARGIHPDTVVNSIDDIVQFIRLKSEISIVVTSLFPTRNNEPRPNKLIDDLNGKLKDYTISSGVKYFDLNPHFKDDAGMLKQEYTEDGLHLTEKAYQKWADLFVKYINELEL